MKAQPIGHVAGDAAAEARLLTTDAGLALLKEVSALGEPGPAELARWRKSADAATVSSAVRLVGCRKKGAAKFARAAAMWLEPVALEQATSEAVARHKARRFSVADVAIDLCAGLGGDALAIAERCAAVIAVDRDHGMARRLAWNAGIYGVDDRVLAVRGDAERFAIPPAALVHIDPDRRASGGRRARDTGDYRPGPGFLRALAKSARGGAIKLGPASDFDRAFGDLGEVELISLRGECKEATLWFGDLAGCRRRATVLPAGATWTDREGPRGDAFPPILDGPRIVLEADPALVRSGLLEGFAAAHGLGRPVAGDDLLATADAVVPTSPFLTAFEVLDNLPLDRKRLRVTISGGGYRVAEVKTRGPVASPEAWRAALRGEGATPVTLFCLSGRSGSRAIVARRLGPPPTSGQVVLAELAEEGTPR